MLQGAESRSPARQIRIHFRFRIGAIAKSSAPQWALYADTADREGGVSVFTLALKIKECQSRSWQGQDGVEYFGKGVAEEIFAPLNVILESNFKLLLFWKIKELSVKVRARARLAVLPTNFFQQKHIS